MSREKEEPTQKYCLFLSFFALIAPFHRKTTDNKSNQTFYASQIEKYHIQSLNVTQKTEQPHKKPDQ